MANENGSLEAALRNAAESPHDEAAWDALEEAAIAVQRVEEVAALYRETLERDLDQEVALSLADRAVSFHDEWSDDAAAVESVLQRVLQLEPAAQWAFDRLSLQMTADGRWDALLALYDRAIERARDDTSRARLLEEVAHVAKDSAGQPERAVEYLKQVFELHPTNGMVAAALERLLRQQERFPELIEFWGERLKVLDGEESLATRQQVASCWLDNLNDPAGALAAVEPLLTDESTTEAACMMLAQILASPASNPEARRKALKHLSRQLDTSDRWDEVVVGLESALQHVEGDERAELHAETARRLVGHDQTDRALPHLAALIALNTTQWDDQRLDPLLAGALVEPIVGCQRNLTREQARDLVRRAARLAADQLGDRERAIFLLERLVDDDATDAPVVRQLAQLYDVAGRVEDLLTLRRRELDHAVVEDDRLRLRLEIARLLQSRDDTRQAVEVLRDNLAERPGHPSSILALITGLETLESHRELAEFLAQQAEAIEERQAEMAAELWSRAAELAEQKLADLERAQRCYERVVALREDALVFDALSRIHVERGEHEAAVGWLQRRLAVALPGDRVDTIVRLAAAHVGAGQQEDAARCLREGLEVDPINLEMRRLLAELYRDSENWEALVALLQEGAELVADEQQRFQLLTEAARIFTQQLRAPERAISVLDHARAINPADRSVRTQLAEALRIAGRLEEARELAAELLEELGRRRVPEKARLHLLLSQIAESGDDMEGALAQLKLAASVDVSNADVQRMLGAVYRRVGELPKAERAFHALLLILRRQASQVYSPVGIAEALFEIYRVARDLGDTERARENLESAFDAAAQSVGESRCLETVLRRVGDAELLMRALRQRLDLAEESRDRGAVLAEVAYVLEEQLGRAGEAFDALLEAVVALPAARDLHDRALVLAERVENGMFRYREALDRSIQAATNAGDRALTCDLLLRVGRLEEDQLDDLDAAAGRYARAESTGQRQADVWRAMARVAAARHDRAEELSALRKVRELPVSDLAGDERVGVLYRLAELQLAFPDALYDGLQTLAEALDGVPDYARAAAALQRALEAAGGDEQVIALYERVARSAWDDELLLDALRRRVEIGGVTQELLEEAYGLAQRLERAEVAESMLLRAVEVARDEVGDLSQALWALRALIRLRQARGQLDDAIHWMREAADVASSDDAQQLRLDVASIAGGQLGNLELAADTYEQLLDEAPGDPAVWQPALEVVRKMGDRIRQERLLTKVSEAASEPHVRNQLRVAKARLLLTAENRLDDAIATLELVLDEDPDHGVAADLLADQLEKAGRVTELAELLEKQIDVACEKENVEQGVNLTLRLGAVLATQRRDEALGAYRSLLEWVPDDGRALAALYQLLDPETEGVERADVLERLVMQQASLVENGELEAGTAMDWTLALVRARDEVADLPGMERALDEAFKIDPRRAEILTELRRLAERLVEAAFNDEDKQNATELLQKAASIHWTRLDDPTAAAGILREAHSMQPDNVQLVGTLVTCLIEVGRADSAIETVTEALERHPGGGEQRIRLLKLRASIRSSLGDHGAAAGDLEEAMSLGAEGLTTELCQALQSAKNAAHAGADHEVERRVTMRLADLLEQSGDVGEARQVLSDWVQNHPLDREAIYDLLALDSAAGRWDEVAVGYSRLVKLEVGDAQTDALIMLADAHEKAGTPNLARESLESIYKLDQGNQRIRGRLRRLYEATGAWRDLSNLLLVEANNSDDDEQRFGLLREAGELRLRQLNAAQTAIGPLMEAHDIRPEDEELILLLADAYTAAHFTEDAVQLLQGAIDRHGDRRSRELGHLLHRMARAVATTGDSDGELRWLAAAWESFPQSGDMASELAERAMQLEAYEVALKALRALAAMRTPAPIARPVALFKQAQIAEIQGDSRKAAFLAKKALSEDGELHEAEVFLKAIAAG